MQNRHRVAIAVACVIGGHSPQSNATSSAPWNGGYIGVNAGNASSTSCNSWALDGVVPHVTAVAPVGSRDCSTSGALVGGLVIGQNFQFRRLVAGVAADLDYWRPKSTSASFKYLGTALPAGTYLFSRKESPSGFALVGARIGYAGDTWLPYVRIGELVALGGRNNELAYTPSGATKATASFSGSKDYSSTGWAAGGGFELGLNGAWSITAEYLHASLGKGSNSSGTCQGLAAACAPYAGASFTTFHEGFHANIVRIGITYWFNYWDL
jgi:outer membrane immunogenic protein